MSVDQYMKDNNLVEIPKCPICDKDLDFIRYSKGFRKFCSRECNNENNKRIKSGSYWTPEKRAEVSKRQKTRFSNMSAEEKKRDAEIKRKGMLEKYGVEYANQLPQNKKKLSAKRSRKTIAKMKEGKLKGFFSKLNQRCPNSLPLFSYQDYSGVWNVEESTGRKSPKLYSFECRHCGEQFKDHFLHILGKGNEPLCPRCFPPKNGNSSRGELAIRKFIEGELGLEVETNKRHYLESGRELDIYIPEKKLAIEYCGEYWHSEGQGKGKNYHVSKLEEASKEGIRLLQFWESEWLIKPDIVKSLIRAATGKSLQIIGARKTVLDNNISKLEVKEFLNLNHIQGSLPYKKAVGLRYNEELVSLITIGPARFSKEADEELLRFANKINTQVQGAFQKLLKAAETTSLITYSDRRLFAGAVYEKAGFIFLRNSSPDYYYFKKAAVCKLESRHKYQKHKLSDALPYFDPKLSESENMKQNNYEKLWGCGNSTWLLEK